jgi:hypothetical protein
MHDAKECRDRALQCIRLAKGLPEGEERKSYADLARSWRRLGRGIEKSEAARRRRLASTTLSLLKPRCLSSSISIC